MIHFTVKTHHKYPKALCGYTGYTGSVTENLDEVTCKACIKAYTPKYVKREINKKFERGERSYI